MIKTNTMKFFCILLTAFLLIGCAPQGILPPVDYSKKTTAHVNKNAIITWEPGQEQYTSMPYSYIKAEKSVFLTSLKNILIRDRIFNQVSIKPSIATLKNNDVEIHIDFKNSEYDDQNFESSLKLTVLLTIKSKHKKLFKREYFVYSTAASKNHLQAHMEVSHELMEYLVNGIIAWSKT